jgi:hypothetical protein
MAILVNDITNVKNAAEIYVASRLARRNGDWELFDSLEIQLYELLDRMSDAEYICYRKAVSNLGRI